MRFSGKFQGFENVNNMGGGYSAWVDSGLAGDKPPEELKTACKFRGWASCEQTTKLIFIYVILCKRRS